MAGEAQKAADEAKKADNVKVVRNAQGLVDALFGSIDRLNAREIDAEHARAISHTARTIVNVARLELEHRKFVSDGGRLTTLAIEGTRT